MKFQRSNNFIQMFLCISFTSTSWRHVADDVIQTLPVHAIHSFPMFTLFGMWIAIVQQPDRTCNCGPGEG